ncbi:hypothetical protein ACDZ29_19855 [Peribacillus sp. RS7]|uniref:hypothetical protein n=1 Tax=Peribacillus sp. RS7 TaxID=3242679 RepID=UPI0035C0882E
MSHFEKEGINAKEAGFKAKSLDEYEKYSKKDFSGTLFTQTQDTKLKENKDVIDYYKIPVDYKVFRYEKGKEDTAVPSTLYADYANGVKCLLYIFTWRFSND